MDTIDAIILRADGSQLMVGHATPAQLNVIVQNEAPGGSWVQIDHEVLRELQRPPEPSKPVSDQLDLFA